MRRTYGLVRCAAVAAVLIGSSLPLRAQLVGDPRSAGDEPVAERGSSVAHERRLDSAAKDDVRADPPPNIACDTGPAGPSALYDEPFERYVDLQLLSRALASRDPFLLTDVALQLAAGEKQLLRPHKAASAGLILRSAIRLAAEQQDRAALTRLSQAAAMLKDTELANQVSAVLKLAGPARAADSTISDLVKDAQPEVRTAFMTAVERIRCAEIAGDTEWLKTVDQAVDDIKPFDDAQKAYLRSAAQAAIEGDSSATADPERIALRKLAQVSRSAGGSWRVVGKNERFSLFPAGTGIDPGSGNFYRKFTFTYEGLIIRGHGELFFYNLGTPLVVARVVTDTPFFGAELKPGGGQTVAGTWNPGAGPGSPFTVNWTLDGNQFPCTFHKVWP